MTKVLKNQLSQVAEHEKVLFYGMLTLVLIVSFMYGYFVRATILNVVAREHAMVESRNLNSQIGDLESSYIAAKNNVTLDLAYEKGFQDVENIHYISLHNNVHILSFNNK